MTARLPRLAICACALVLVLALIASQVVGGSSDREAKVGTEGSAAEVDRDDHEATPFLPGDGHTTSTARNGDDDERTSTNADDDGSPTSTTRPSGGSEATTTTTAGPRFLGPDHLRGRLVFVHDEPAANTLYSSELDGSDRRVEVPCPGAQWATFPAAVSPDGTLVARVCTTTPQFVDFEAPLGRADLVVQRVDGTWTRTLVAEVSRDVDGIAWSPDGSHLAVVSGARLRVTDVTDGSTETVIVRDPEGEEVWASGKVSWSPDGTALLLTGPTVVDLHTGTSRRIGGATWGAQQWGGSDLVAWAPDGWIYFRWRPQLIGPDPPTAQPLRRTHPDDEYAELVLEDLTPHESIPGFIEPPVFVDADTALVPRNGQLWRLEIGVVDEAWRFVQPSGQLTLVNDSFAGWYLSVPAG